MATYTKSQAIQGKWVKGGEIESGSSCKLVSETNPVPSQFKTKDGAVKNQDVAKIQFEGKEVMNISINRASINALVDAFGEDSKKWQGQLLKAITEKVVVGGKRVTAIYLVPEGYSITEDSNGYVVIAKDGDPNIGELPEINLDEVPF